jgi:hypothetical protein
MKKDRSPLSTYGAILAASDSTAAKVAGELCEDGPMMKKPYDHKLLADRIKQLLAGRRKSSP